MTYKEYMALLKAGKVPKQMKFKAGDGSAVIKAVHEDDEENKLRTFTGRAYNGGVMTVGFFGDVVIDLAGLEVSAKQRPMLKDHDPLTPVGHTASLNGSGNGVTIGTDFIDVEGVFSIVSEATDLVVNGSDNGFEWQMSVTVDPTKLIFVDEDQTIEANGREFTGPILVAREGILKEISFLPLGADDTTTSVAASVAEFKETESYMTFKEWLKACGHNDESKLKEDELKLLKASFEQFQITAKKAETKVEPKVEPVVVPVIEAKAEPKDLDIKAQIKAGIDDGMVKANANLLEANKIATLCAGDAELHEEAIKAGWSSDQVKDQKELRELRANRDSNSDGFNIGNGSSGSVESSDMVISLLRAGGYDEKKIIAEYGEKAIEASDKQFGMRLGLQESMVIAGRINGYTGRSFSFNKDPSGYFEAAFASQRQMIQAGTSFGTMDLSGILSNVANKFFVDGFNDVEATWRDIAAIRNVSDFKEVSSYSLVGNMDYELVGPGGEIKSADTDEVKYTNQIDTYAKMYGINRHNLINDDLDALSRIPFKLGRGGAIKFNKVFWTIFLANTAFFTAGKGNLTTGAALSITELTAMVTAFRLLKDPDGNPMATRPDILLVGAENETLASQLFVDLNIQSGSTVAGGVLDGNPHKAKYRTVVSTYVSDTTIGGDATQSYLLANPNSVAVIEAAFLNGVQTPTVETAQARFDTLGIDMRGFHDFGVRLQEERGGVRSNGA